MNSDPFTLASQRGKVVLLDFWTYSCVNCLRTLPHLRGWHERYADHGLVIVGVHSPEFQFEHDLDNLRNAVEDTNIPWAVVQDNGHETWDAYNNVFWPTKYLIDGNGLVRYHIAGEGGYAKTEAWIRALLTEAGGHLSAVEPLDPQGLVVSPYHDDDQVEDDPSIGLYDRYASDAIREEDEGSVPTIGSSRLFDVTSELYGGYKKGCGPKFFSNSGIGDARYCLSRDVKALYEDPGQHETHMLYLQGLWAAEADSLRHGRSTSGPEDYIVLRYAAQSVNAVLSPGSGQASEVLVTLDGEFLSKANKGRDAVIGEDGRSFLIVDRPRMYELVAAPEFGVRDLKIAPGPGGFRLFTFTFGADDEGR